MHLDNETPRKSAALKSKVCRLPKLNLLFPAFWKFLAKIIEFILFKAKLCSPINNYRIMKSFLNVFEFFEFLEYYFSVRQVFQPHVLSFYGQTILFGLFR